MLRLRHHHKPEEFSLLFSDQTGNLPCLLEKKSKEGAEVDTHAPGPQEAGDELAGQIEGPAVLGEEITHLLAHREWQLYCCDHKIFTFFLQFYRSDVLILFLHFDKSYLYYSNDIDGLMEQI